MGYYNQPVGNKLADKLSELELLLRKLALEGSIEALDLLETITRNVIQNRTEEKYRRVRTTNAKLSPLFGQTGTFDIMQEMGWQLEGEFLVLPMDVQLDFQKHIVTILEAKSWYGKQKELAKKSDKMAGDPNKAVVLRQLEIDRRERAAGAGYPTTAAAPPVAPAAVPVAVARPAVAAAQAAPPAKETSARQAEPPAVSEEVQELISMGFAKDRARGALVASGNDTGRAIELLLSQDAEDQETACTPAPRQAQANHPKPQKTASDFERRTDPEKKRNEAGMSLAELRQAQKEKYNDFKADPNAAKSDAYKQPPATGGTEEAGWFDWMWGGSSSSSGGGGGGGYGGGGGQQKPRMKTIRDLPQPARRGGG